MEIIQGDRCSGKTTQAIKKAIETGSILVVRSHNHAKMIRKNNPGLRVIPVRSFLEKRYFKYSYVIDSVEDLFAPGDVIAFTTSGKPNKRLKQPRRLTRFLKGKLHG